MSSAWTGQSGSPTRLLLLRHGQTVLSIDRRYSGHGDPELTTVKMPLREMGSAAVESLLALVEGRQVEDVQVATPPELVVRGSTAPPRSH